MNKEEQLQRLLRLKRHEQPPEGFAEEFLEEFQRRQRSELVRRSALSILGERLQAWLEGLRRPAVIWGAAGAYAVLMLTLWLLPRPTPQSDVTMIVGTENPATAPVDHRINNSGTEPKIVPLPNYQGPGKRRTTDQEQNKESLIGPEEKNPEKSADPPLRDL